MSEHTYKLRFVAGMLQNILRGLAAFGLILAFGLSAIAIFALLSLIY